MYFGQNLDAMIEARNAREWEELNKTVKPNYTEIDEGLDEALDGLKDTYQAIADAALEANGSPNEYRISALLIDLDNIRDELTSLKNRLREEAKSA